MGSVYPRKRKDGAVGFWIAYKTVSGRRVCVDAKTQDRDKAQARLEMTERMIQAELDLRFGDESPLTYGRYVAKVWLPKRHSRVLTAHEEETRLRHVMPRLGHMRLTEIRAKDIREAIRAVWDKGELAPRTVNHVYAALRLSFRDAVKDELIPSTPCVLSERDGELPPKEDKDLLWRDTAIFTRDELEALISDPRLPWPDRVRNALLFLTGMRIGEVVVRRWRDYDTNTDRLGKLSVNSGWSSKDREERAPKKRKVRSVPVHPVLASILLEWRNRGWKEQHGREPGPEDFIAPSPDTGRLLPGPSAYRRLQANLETLGMRPRRQHDTRRTFVSLAIDDGARPEILRWITHGRKSDIISLYSTLSWLTLCDEVAVLKVRRNEGQLALLPSAT